MAQSEIRYAAEIEHVQEVTLAGTADRDFWQQQLQRYGLRAYAPAGAAQVVISASALAWRGFRFRELIVSIVTCADARAAEADSSFLAQGFSSSRPLAWAERRLFATPYAYAGTRLAIDRPQIETQLRGQVLLQARMGQQGPATRSDEAWRGRVFLPGAPAAPRRFFYVALSGTQIISPFAPNSDRFEIAPNATVPVFQWLRASQFTPTEWRIRADATHARSQTYAG